MKSSTSTEQFQPFGTVSIPQIHHLTVLCHFPCLFRLYTPVSRCSSAKKTWMKAYKCSELQPKMQVEGLPASGIYVNRHPWRASSDTPPSQLRTTTLCHQCKLALLWPQPSTHSIPNLLSQ